MITSRAWLVALVALALAGCAPQAQPPSEQGERGEQPTKSRSLVIALRGEPTSLSAAPLQRAQLIPGSPVLIFNATLTIEAIEGARLLMRPYLVENLPELNTPSWRVFDDGRMETIYPLRPGLTWHDGTPLSARDFVFSWQVYGMPDFGVAASLPWNKIEDVTAPDERTVLVRWRQPYPDAGILGGGGQGGGNFPPLPRHILEAPLQQGPGDAFSANPYWTTEYVGLGPYRLDRWEPGAFIEAEAFGGHVWGRPKIQRLRLLFISDFNTVLANLLAGEADMSLDNSIRFEQGAILRREWSASGAGVVLSAPNTWRRTYFQLRPELVNPRALLDVRVRRALAHAFDRQTLNEGLFDGEAIVTETMITPQESYYAELDRAIVKYPYDVRRTEQLINEVGFARGANGFYTSPADGGGRFGFELRVVASAQNEAERAIMANGWRQVGFDVREGILPVAQANDETAVTFPSLYSYGGSIGESQLPDFTTSALPRAETRWRGNNRSGWVSPEFDRLFDTFNTTLDRAERNQQVIQMQRLITEELPVLSLYFNPSFVAYVSSLRGLPRVAGRTGTFVWNIHEWDWR